MSHCAQRKGAWHCFEEFHSFDLIGILTKEYYGISRDNSKKLGIIFVVGMPLHRHLSL